jgi:hypothetical protein
MTVTSHVPSNETMLAALDLSVEVSTRLLTMLDGMEAVQRARFYAAAKKAGEALEVLTPAVLMATRDGLVSGLFAMVNPKAMVVVLASPKRHLVSALQVSDLADVMKETERAERELGEQMRASEGARVVAMALEQRKCNDVVAGYLLRLPQAVDFIRVLSGAGIIPALVALVSEDGKGLVRFVMPHARPVPPEADADD